MKGDIMPEYQNYIMQILNTRGRFGCGEEYHERHHIVLRCMGGADTEDNLIDLYIVPLIRCNETIACELTDDIYCKCLTYFKEDIIKYNFQYILLLGDAGRRFLQIDIKSNLENIIISPNNRFYNVNYSPLIKYVDEEKFDIFTSYLRKWYCSCKTKYFPYKTYTRL